MTCDRNLFETKVPCDDESSVVIPNGDTIPVEGKGACSLPNGMKIGNVLYIPGFKCNLLSVSRLTNDLNCAVIFYHDFFLVQGLHEKNLIGMGKCNGGLYRMDSVVKEQKAFMTALDVEVWHKRLGHTSESKLSQVKLLGNFVNKLNSKVCDSCVRAKHTRLPFPSSNIKSDACFDLIHCDI